MPVPATPQEFERRLGGGRTASGVGTKQAGREISGLRGRDRRRGDGKRPQGARGRLRSGAAPGDDSSDHIIEVGVVVDPGLPRLIGRVRVVNAGSVGMPFGSPGADWLLLGPDIQLRHTDYDLPRAAERVRSADYPQAEEFASKDILHPPAEAEMLELFTRVGTS